MFSAFRVISSSVTFGRRFSGRLEMTYRLDAERLSSSKLTRLLFVRREPRRSVEASVVEDSLTMNRQTDANSVCHSYIAHIVVSLRVSALPQSLARWRHGSGN